jgi:hypothetical protein
MPSAEFAVRPPTQTGAAAVTFQCPSECHSLESNSSALLRRDQLLYLGMKILELLGFTLPSLLQRKLRSALESVEDLLDPELGV